MKKDFIPGRNSNLYTFAGNFLERLVKHSGDLSLNASEVETARSVLVKHRKAFAKMISLKAESKSATEEFYADKKKTVDMIRKMSNHIKSSRKYNRAIGQDFKIINRYTPVLDFSNHKPVLKAKTNAEQVIIKFAKNRTTGLKLYSRRVSESKFSEIAFITKVSFTDKRPKLSPSIPEAREYYGYYIVNDKIAGKRSDVIKVIVP